jgi:mutator protein MutT
MKVINVCAALIFANGKVLLTCRPDHQDHAGFWEFPGGKLEAGETPAQCLQRELKEELALEVSVFDTVYMLEHRYPGKHVSLRFMRCIAKQGQHPRAMEKQQFAWVKFDELGEYPLLPADQPLAEFLTLF